MQVELGLTETARRLVICNQPRVLWLHLQTTLYQPTSQPALQPAIASSIWNQTHMEFSCSRFTLNLNSLVWSHGWFAALNLLWQNLWDFSIFPNLYANSSSIQVAILQHSSPVCAQEEEIPCNWTCSIFRTSDLKNTNTPTHKKQVKKPQWLWFGWICMPVLPDCAPVY